MTTAITIREYRSGDLPAIAALFHATVHASITARPFFERRGYAVVRGQRVRRHGVMLENYVMCRTGVVS